MKPDKLTKITNGKYCVDEDFCIRTQDNKKLCNFYIKEFTIYTLAEKEVSFYIKLQNRDEKDSAVIPIEYIYTPNSWMHLYFKKNFKICSPHFETGIIDIINELSDLDETYQEINYGWESKILSRRNYDWAFDTYSRVFGFDCFDDEDDIDNYKSLCSHSCLLECLAVAHRDAAVPLISYTLLSLLLSLEIWGDGRRPDFIMSLTGASEEVRSQTALFYTNLHNRMSDMKKNDYRDIHIMPEDKLADVLYKTIRVKDSVVIAFHPQKKQQCRHLYNIYTQTHLEDKYTVNGMLLLLKADREEIDFPTVNVNLPKDYDLKTIKNNFWVATEDEETEDETDFYLSDMYHFIHFLLKKMNKNENYVAQQYAAYLNQIQQDADILALTEDARNVFIALSFTIFLYLIYRTDKNEFAKKYQLEDIEGLCKSILIGVSKSAYPALGDVINSDIDRAKEICRVLDEYFAKKSNRRCLAMIGEENSLPTEVKAWGDENLLYITARTLNEILKLQDDKGKFTLAVKRALAHEGLIEYYMVGGDKPRPEYSVHIQKPLYGAHKSKVRFVAFRREECAKYHLFPHIEDILSPPPNDSEKELPADAETF